MAKIRAKSLLLAFCGLLALGAAAARAQGVHSGFWRFGGPSFGGPRFDGPRYYDAPRYYEGPRDYEGQRPYEVETEAPLPPPEHEMRPPGPRVCYSPAETRERVVSGKLREPFALMRKASAIAHADALSGKLCRWDDLDIYEISLLRPDGRVVHVYLNAATGQVVGGRDAR